MLSEAWDIRVIKLVYERDPKQDWISVTDLVLHNPGLFSQVGEREFFVNFWKTCIAKTRNGESQTACKLPY